MKAVHWEARARREYEDAIAVSPNPITFDRNVENALQKIASGFVTHAQVSRSQARECILKTPPYSIIYIETDDEIRVWAFAHNKRKPGYWRRRLPKK